LASEYFAKGAFEQYGLPFTILRPFNCVGIGEMRAITGKTVKSGNINLAMSHVVPDLVQKMLKGQYPLHILGKGNQVRHYTYGGDLAEGIKLAIFSPKAINNDFNLSTADSTTVLELARLIWKKTNQKKPFKYVSDKPFTYERPKKDTRYYESQKNPRFEAKTDLNTILDELIPWIKGQISLNLI